MHLTEKENLSGVVLLIDTSFYTYVFVAMY